MLAFNKLKKNTMYRTTSDFSLPYNLKKSDRGSIIAVLARNITETTNYLDNKYINLKYYRRFHTPFKIRFKATNKQEIITRDTKLLYKKYIASNPNLDLDFVKTVSMIRGYNIINDISPYIKLTYDDETYDTYSVTTKAITVGKNIIKALRMGPNNDKELINKTVLIPVDTFIDDPKSPTLFTAKSNLGNPINDLIYTMQIHPELFTSLKGWKLMFMNVNEMFFIEVDDFIKDDQETINDIISLFKLFRSKAGNADLENTDDEKIEEIKDNIKSVDEDLQKVDISQKNANKIHTKIEKNIDKGMDVDKAIEKAKGTTLNDIKKEMVPSATNKQAMGRQKKIQKVESKKIIKSETFNEVVKNKERTTIPPTTLNVDVINPALKNLGFNNFAAGYMDQLFDYDLNNMFNIFKDLPEPMTMVGEPKIEDVSTTLDQINKYTIVMKDKNNKKHTIKFNIPKIIDGKFLYLGGAAKQIQTQKTSIPIIKIAPDKVQITMVYNKLFMERTGSKVSPKVTMFRALLGDLNHPNIKLELGNTSRNNKPYLTSIEYDAVGEMINKIIIAKHIVYFDQKEIRNICKKDNLEFDDSTVIPFSIENGKLLTYNITDGFITGTTTSMLDYLAKLISDNDGDFLSKFKKAKQGKAELYSRVKIMSLWIPTIVLLGFWFGLSATMKENNIKYSFHEEKPTIDSLNQKIIQFKDGYLVYDIYPFKNALLLNGLSKFPTEDYNFIDMDESFPYEQLFKIEYNNFRLGNALLNYKYMLLLPKDKEILSDFDLPTTLIGVLSYCNELLENNAMDDENSLYFKRYRNMEIIVDTLFEHISKAYGNYRSTANNRNPKPFTIPENAVLTSLKQSELIENSPATSPIIEAERDRTTSPKGQRGINLDRALTIDKRGYNESNVGVDAATSPISANIGVSRTLTIDPNIMSLRGYPKPGSKKTVKDLPITKLLSPAEALIPGIDRLDDAPRKAIAGIQSRHTTSTVVSDKLLYGYGYENIIAHQLSNRFIYKASQSGKISEIDEKNKLIILKYDDGSEDAINMNMRQEKDSATGTFINIVPECPFKEGYKFKANDILMYDSTFFAYDEFTGNVTLLSGTMCTYCIITNSETFEDSGTQTRRFSDKIGTYVSHERNVTLGPNTEVYQMVKIGDKIRINEPLITYDESLGGDESFYNQMIANMREDEGTFNDALKSKILSKYTGEIADIKVWYTIPKESLSGSLNELVITPYEKRIGDRNDKLANHDINHMNNITTLETLGVTKPSNGKIKGVDVDESEYPVLIQFYIRELNQFVSGSKVTVASVALKEITSREIPYGKEPYVLGNPNYLIDSIGPTTGSFARKVGSLVPMIVMNKSILHVEMEIIKLLEENIRPLNIPKDKYNGLAPNDVRHKEL